MSCRHGRSPGAALVICAATAIGLPVVAIAPARAQEGSPPAKPPEATIEQIDNPQVFNLWLDPENYPRIERAVNVANARTTRARALNFLVDHRAYAAFQKDAFRDGLGFDFGSLKIGLTLRYGILDNLEVGVQRLSNGPDVFDVYQFDAKVWALRADRCFVDVAVRAGGTWYAMYQGPDSGGGFAQLIISRSLRERLWLSSGLLYHSNASNNVRTSRSQDYALAIPVALEVRLQTFLAWDAEASFNVAGHHAKYPILATALKIVTNRHTFAIIFSNSQYITADGLVANTSKGIHDVILGFTITREFNL
ncbi:MAG TPA: DUF5777 family beta-barrel protein [Polyangia bacterium]|nr:DUF5777 family beta-barrel protein [Polyangia bacterium]